MKDHEISNGCVLSWLTLQGNSIVDPSTTRDDGSRLEERLLPLPPPVTPVPLERRSSSLKQETRRLVLTIRSRRIGGTDATGTDRLLVGGILMMLLMKMKMW